ncbi:unnamed protein product [Agarophyton chilense]
MAPNSHDASEAALHTQTKSINDAVIFQIPANTAKVIPPNTPQWFVMKNFEKAWVIRQLMNLNAPLQKVKKLYKTSARVAAAAKMRHVPDATILREQKEFGINYGR